MATRVQKIKVLLFLIICIALMAGGIALIKGFTHVPVTLYKIEFSESVLGLYPGAYVVYQGVPVGKVKDLDVDETGVARVLIEVEQHKVTLRKGVKAQLVLYSLATGSLAVNLYGGDPTAEPLPPGSIIESERSFLGAAGEQTSTLLSNLSQVAETINTALEGIEKGAFAETIKKINSTVDEAQKTITTVREQVERIGNHFETGVTSFQELSQNLSQTAQKTRDVLQELQSKLHDIDTAQLNDKLLSTLQQTHSLFNRLETAVDSLEKTAALVLQDTQHVEFKLRETLEAVHETVAAFQELIEYLQQDPSALVRGKGKPRGEQR